MGYIRQSGEEYPGGLLAEYQTNAEDVKNFVDAGNRNLGNLVQFSAICCDAVAARLLKNAYKRARPRKGGMLDVVGRYVAGHNGTDLFAED